MKFSKIFCLIFSLFLFSCKTSNIEKNQNLQNQSDFSEFEKLNFDSDVIQIVKKMSTRQKIGQVMILNFRYVAANETFQNLDRVTDFKTLDSKIIKVAPLNQVNKTVETALKDFHIGNVILFSENLFDTKKAFYFIQDLQNIAIKNGDLPLTISVDQEGGVVNRIFDTTIFPSAREIAKSGDKKIAFTQGQFLAEQLLSLGINLDFAPVCDVDSNPKNPVIGNRSYSSSPKIVSEFASSLHQGLKSKNVISCAKHFPGHGDTEVDSHIGLPKIEKSKSEWAQIEKVPFEALIKNQVPVIMSAHIQYPALDNSTIIAKKTGKKIVRPATLSKKILTNLLKNEMGFTGVICTDALDMKAISKNFTESQAVLEALNAGADLICNPISIIEEKDLARLEKLFEEIESALDSGKLSYDRLNEAVLKIVQLKKNYKILETREKNLTQKDFENTKKILSSEKYKTILK